MPTIREQVTACRRILMESAGTADCEGDPKAYESGAYVAAMLVLQNAELFAAAGETRAERDKLKDCNFRAAILHGELVTKCDQLAAQLRGLCSALGVCDSAESNEFSKLVAEAHEEIEDLNKIAVGKQSPRYAALAAYAGQLRGLLMIVDDVDEALGELTDYVRAKIRTALSLTPPDAVAKLGAEREETSKFLQAFQDWACNCAQLLDGWHCDIAWSEWDTEVRKQLSNLQRTAAALAAKQEGEHDGTA